MLSYKNIGKFLSFFSVSNMLFSSISQNLVSDKSTLLSKIMRDPASLSVSPFGDNHNAILRGTCAQMISCQLSLKYQERLYQNVFLAYVNCKQVFLVQNESHFIHTCRRIRFAELDDRVEHYFCYNISGKVKVSSSHGW